MSLGFLSYLYGSEPFKPPGSLRKTFLSYLYGSEQKTT